MNLDELTRAAIDHHADGATAEFYRRLREHRRFFTTRCPACGHPSYPPRSFCPACFGEEVEWFDVGDHAVLYAFTTQQRALRFTAPDVIGVVEIAGLGRVLTKINAPFESLRIGQPLRFEPCELSPELVVHSYTPVG